MTIGAIEAYRPVGVADPNNIIFAEIASHLYLDDNDRAGVIAKCVMGAK